MIAPIVWYEQSARSRPRPNNNRFGPRPRHSRKWRLSMKVQTSWPLVFLLLPVYGEEGKEKPDDINVDFGYASKPNFSPRDF